MNSLHSYGIRLESIDLKKLPRWICCLGLWDRHLCLRFIVKMPANRWYHYFKVIVVQTCATWWYSTAVLVEKIRRAICRNLKAGTHLRYHTITVEVCSKFFNYCLRASLAIWSPSLDDGWHHEILADWRAVKTWSLQDHIRMCFHLLEYLKTTCLWIVFPCVAYRL